MTFVLSAPVQDIDLEKDVESRAAYAKQISTYFQWVKQLQEKRCAPHAVNKTPHKASTWGILRLITTSVSPVQLAADNCRALALCARWCPITRCQSVCF